MAEVVQPDVVRRRIARHVAERLGLGHAVHAPADHGRHLALVVQEASAARAAQDDLRCPFSVDGGFMKYDGSAGTLAPYSSTRLR